VQELITELKSCYPNPFQTSTSIHYSVKEAVPVEIRIYKARGELVHKLVNDNRVPGNYHIVWDGRTQNGTLALSGIYFYQMKAGNFNSQIKKLLLMK
jgi:flagellar hook assembly protein FlgD